MERRTPRVCGLSCKARRRTLSPPTARRTLAGGSGTATCSSSRVVRAPRGPGRARHGSPRAHGSHPNLEGAAWAWGFACGPPAAACACRACAARASRRPWSVFGTARGSRQAVCHGLRPQPRPGSPSVTGPRRKPGKLRRLLPSPRSAPRPGRTTCEFRRGRAPARVAPVHTARAGAPSSSSSAHSGAGPMRGRLGAAGGGG